MDDFLMMMHPAIGPSIALLNEVVPKTNKLDIVSFGSFFCMLLEEWCLTHNEDAPKLALDLAYMVDAVNKSEGKYQRDEPLFEGEVF